MHPVLSAMPDPIPGLGPAVRPEAWGEEAVAIAGTALVAGLPQRRADLLLACLLLWHDRLEAAHRLVQRHEGDPDADCLHAIMHRREPDEANSRYWWSRVGVHPLATELADKAEKSQQSGLLSSQGIFLPAAMATACCQGSLPETALRILQAHELRLMALRIFAP
jgi:hypothetical protein